MKAADVVKALRKVADADRAKVSTGFFKTGVDEYGEGDRFLGVTVPVQRVIAKKYRDLTFSETEKLLANAYHEVRLVGLLILVCGFEVADEKYRKEIYRFYLAHRSRINNWDLVDVTAPRIVGVYLIKKKSERKILYRFVTSKNLWERRMAIVATLAFIQECDFTDTLAFAELLLNDQEDLIHKATGWMLREVGKRDKSILNGFLKGHVSRMPRMMLRYAIERHTEWERRKWMKH